MVKSPKESWLALSVLVVGFGSIGKRHLRILQELGIKKLSVVDPREDRRETATRDFGITRVYENIEQGLLDKPQTVFICSPTDFHLEQAEMSLLSGADVMVEKPLSNSLDGTERLQNLANEFGKIVMVAHCFRFHEGLQRARTLLQEGVIGRLLSIRASVGEYIPDVMPDYRNMYISSLNGVYELMHEIDLALWFADQPPVRVFGIHGRFSDVGMKSPDMVEILIEFKQQCLASVHLDFFQRARRRQIDLLGTKGTILVDFARWDECLISLYRSKTHTWTYKKLITDRDDMFREEDRLFLQAVASRSPSPLGIAEGRLSLQVIDAVKECQHTYAAVTLPVKQVPLTQPWEGEETEHSALLQGGTVETRQFTSKKSD